MEIETYSTANIKVDSIPIGYVLISRSDIDRANADAELCDFFRDQYPNVESIKDLYKKGYRIAMKIDTVNGHVQQVDQNIIILTTENYKKLQRSINKSKFALFLARAKDPLLFVGGAIFGGFIVHSYHKL